MLLRTSGKWKEMFKLGIIRKNLRHILLSLNSEGKFETKQLISQALVVYSTEIIIDFDISIAGVVKQLLLRELGGNSTHRIY